MGTANVLTAWEIRKLDKWSGSLNKKIKLGQRIQHLTLQGTLAGGGATPFIADGNITANDIICVSGYDTTSGLLKMKQADADTAALTQDLFWSAEAVLDTIEGTARKQGNFVSALNGTIGAPVYLSQTVGGVTLTAPSGATTWVVKVGSLATAGASGRVSVDLAGAEKIIAHNHSDDSTGGTLSSIAGLTGTTETTFTVDAGTTHSELVLSAATAGSTGFDLILKAGSVATADRTVTLPDPGGADSVVYDALAATLTNKTLTDPTIDDGAAGAGFTNAQHDHSDTANGGTISTPALAGTTSTTWSLLPATNDGDLVLSVTGGGSDNSVTITNSVTTGDIILTLPNATDTLVGVALAQTLTSKTLTAPIINACTITGAVTITTPTVTGTWTNLGAVTTVDINGGTVDGTAIGGSTPAAGAFTTIAASADVTIAAGQDLILAQGAGEIKLNAASSGGIIIKPTSTTTSLVTISTVSQTGAQTISIPDLTGGADTFATLKLANAFTANCIFSGAPTFASITGNDASLGVTGTDGAGGGAGGIVAIAGGLGHTNGAGGAVTTVGGGGAGTGAGGLVSVTGGASGAGATGNGGAASLVGGAAASVNGAGGAAAVTGGAGNGTGNGGAITLTGGLAGTGATGNGGAASLTGGAASVTNGTGGAASLIGGIGVGTGAGGAVTITGGAGTTSTGNGGAVAIEGGATASGTAGAITIGTSGTGTVTVGNTSVVTTIVGQDLVLSSYAAGTFEIASVDVFQWDASAITLAAAASTAGQALYMGSAGGGAAGSSEDGKAGAAWAITCGSGSNGYSAQNQAGAAG
ncbi:MAG TPA: hypothetical protein VMY35_04725, partial [Phycisphaerae bacterium]|nr:hypothetical protein [Phycisphaerae bacterium]